MEPKTRDRHETPPKNAADARGTVTTRHLKKFIRLLGCEREFLKDQERFDFPAARLNYHRTLWVWVWKLTPGDVLDKVNEACFVPLNTPATEANFCIARHEYLLWRAIFLVGMKAGEGFKASHYRYFARFAAVADWLDDDEIFNAARQRRWNWKKAKVQDKRTSIERQLKYCLFVSWLPGGLWRMASRNEQLTALRKWWPDSPPYSSDAIEKAQTRLGLQWFKSASD